ncbi:MAG: NAD-dependent succinate-semialdehyde dehydrogenase [Calditrichaceae bacterium]
MGFKSINPVNGELIEAYEEMTAGVIDDLIQKAHRAHLIWKEKPMSERALLMKKAALLLKDKAEDFGRLMTHEMGKPLKSGIAEAEKCAWVCEYYAENAEKFLQPENIKTDAAKSFVTFEPLGVVLAIMPWNFPFWQVFRFAAPGLMAGNGAILKHASNVSGCGLAIEGIFKEAGFPEHLFTTLLTDKKGVSKVIENPLIAAVTLTGSVPAGKAVAQKAGEMLKKTVLELGGSDPYVILTDADFDAAVQTCVNSRIINSGQSCIAAKRFIVPEIIADTFEERYVEQMRAKKMGDPLDDDTDIGPQARHDLRDDLHRQVKESIDKGAKCLLGGEIPEGDGAYYPPTVLTNVKPGMPAFDEELFGPVAAIIRVRDEEEAIEFANNSAFGLGAAVFTKDIKKGEKIAAGQLEAGCCFVNAFVKSDPRLPFGGIKQSGYGRELSHYGIKEFVNIKTVYVN